MQVGLFTLGEEGASGNTSWYEMFTEFEHTAEERKKSSSVNSSLELFQVIVGILDVCLLRREVMDHGEKEELCY